MPGGAHAALCNRFTFSSDSGMQRARAKALTGNICPKLMSQTPLSMLHGLALAPPSTRLGVLHSPVAMNLRIVIASKVVNGRQDRYTRSLKERKQLFQGRIATLHLTLPSKYLTLLRPTSTSSPAISATPSTSLPHSTPSSSPALHTNSVSRHSCTRWKHFRRQGVYR